MDDSPCRQFFAQPSGSLHKKYEALRAVFLEGRSQKEVAQHFGYAYPTLRQMVCDFRAACQQEQRPPFFFRLLEGGLGAARPNRRSFPKCLAAQTDANSSSPPRSL